jgi:hypothetical protein
MRILPAVILALSAAPLAQAQSVAEPRSGVTFEKTRRDQALIGVGLRTRTLLKVHVYAVGLYVQQDALSSPPFAGERGVLKSPDFYRALVSGDAPRTVQLKFVRDLTLEQVQDAMRSALAKANRTYVDQFVQYFGPVQQGHEATFEWLPGGVLKTTVTGQPWPDIADRAFASAVFGIWLGEHPLQDDLKADLVKLF